MDVEISITAEEDEMEVVEDVIATIRGDSAIGLISKRERYVLRALLKNSEGAARRVIHGDAAVIDDSPFRDRDDDTERSEVGRILERLEDIGLARQEQATWYPEVDSELSEVVANIDDDD